MPSSISSSDAHADAGLAKRRLGALVAVFIALNALAIVVWQAIPFTQVSEERYLAAIPDHVEMLARSKGEEGRIVLLGGSGVAFSISAEALTEQLDRPVYNGGIQASIGFRNLTDLYLPQLDPERDLLVIVPEIALITTDTRHTRTYCDVIYLAKRVGLLLARPRCLPTIVNRTWQEVRFTVTGTQASDPVYRRSGFNELGDLTSHLDLAGSAPDLTDFVLPDVSEERLSVFENYVRDKLIARGFEVAVIPSALPQNACRASGARLQAMLDRLDRLNTRPSPAPDAARYCLPADMFFDGASHLNARGRVLQTEAVRAFLARFGSS